MKLTVENTVTGPLAHKRTLHELERIVETSGSLDEAEKAVSVMPNLATYRGGHHVAIHPKYNGEFAWGSDRLAIITEA